MKKHRLFSLFTSLVVFASLASCAVPETTSTTKSAPAPKAQATVETKSEEVGKLVINDSKTSENAVRLFWNEIEGASKYEVEVKGKSDWLLISTFSSYQEKGFRIEGFDSDTSYTFRVTAKFKNRDKKDDITSEPVTVKTKSKKTTTTTYQEYVERSNDWNNYEPTYTTTRKVYTPPATTQQQVYGGSYFYTEKGNCYHYDSGCYHLNGCDVKWSDTKPAGKRACSDCCPVGY